MFLHAGIFGSTNDPKIEKQENCFLHNDDLLIQSTDLSNTVLLSFEDVQKIESLFQPWDKQYFDQETDKKPLGMWYYLYNNYQVVTDYKNNWLNGQNTTFDPRINESINRRIFSEFQTVLTTENSDIADLILFLEIVSDPLLPISLWTTETIHQTKKPNNGQNQTNFGSLLNQKRGEFFRKIKENYLAVINQLRGNTLNAQSPQLLLQQIDSIAPENIRNNINLLYKIAQQIKQISQNDFSLNQNELNLSVEQIFKLAIPETVAELLNIKKSLEQENGIRQKTTTKTVTLIRKALSGTTEKSTPSNPTNNNN
jgi:hypothetical protein